MLKLSVKLCVRLMTLIKSNIATEALDMLKMLMKLIMLMRLMKLMQLCMVRKLYVKLFGEACDEAVW